MPSGAGAEALGHASKLELLSSYRGKLSASLLPNIDRGTLQQDAMQEEVHAPPQLSGREPLPPDVPPGCPGQPSVSVPLGISTEALGRGGLPGCPAHTSTSLPVATCRELVRHGSPAASLPPTSRQALQADAQFQIDLWADKSRPAGAVVPAASKFKDGEIGTETFPDCMYVGTFKHGMRNGLGALHAPCLHAAGQKHAMPTTCISSPAGCTGCESSSTASTGTQGKCSVLSGSRPASEPHA